MDERAFIARIEGANAEEFRELLANPTPDEQRVLRVHLGQQRYQHMHGLALKASRPPQRPRSIFGARAGDAPPRGNVVVIPGVMGSELTSFDRSGDGDHIWLDLPRIAFGRLSRLHLDASGRDEHAAGYDVRATGILKRYYGELLLSLSQHWNAKAFWYDWRKDLTVAAAALSAELRGWFDAGDPVHIVAHSMGGLVARTFIRDYPEQWDTMKDPGDRDSGRPALTLGGRLVMLGTPNHGSFAIAQTIMGLEETLHKLAMLDLRHGADDILDVFNSFVGPYQMLPSLLEVASARPLYNAATYGGIDILPGRLEIARQHHERLRNTVQADRMVFVAGSDRATITGIADYAQLGSPDAYTITRDGDGRVPHVLARLVAQDGTTVPMLYVDEDHGGLSSNPTVLDAMDDLLETGTSGRLSPKPVTRRGSGTRAALEDDPRQEFEQAQLADAAALELLLGRSRSWRMAIDASERRGDDGDAGAGGEELLASFHEREIEEIITHGVVGSRDASAGVAEVEIPFGPTTIEIRLVGGGIEKAGTGQTTDLPIDVIAVGHYLGVRPDGAELALDLAISASGRGGRAASPVTGRTDLMLTQFAERGTIRGELGQTFFLPDPRQSNASRKADGGRSIAIAGMGVSGRFGTPELAVVARELCWSVGRMGANHLATVLIGAGKGNLSARDATLAWLRGIKQAITGMDEGDRRRLQRITFVELNPASFLAMHQAIVDEQERLKRTNRLEIAFTPLSEKERDTVVRRLQRPRQASARPASDANTFRDEQAPSRLTVTVDSGRYKLGAISAGASIAERDITLDPPLLAAANDELAGAWDPAMQYDRGRFLEQLLIPDELRGQIHSPAPLVLMLDATTARIHWEMLAHADLTRGESDDVAGTSDRLPLGDTPFEERLFFGTTRGLTRQLRTAFAPPPDPTPPPRRVMRVLVVADPAADKPLPGAEEEGVTVADLFEEFNTIHSDTENRIVVVRLIGPQEATRTNVLRELLNRSYDVLHFAGHCMFDKDNPAASGWIFSNGERISASELARVDRVPKFVFSNACESGITPERAGERTAALAPSFAEAVFGRGVANFVCTAWPVDDVASARFARTLYEGLLGLRPVAQPNGRTTYSPLPLLPMHEAMLAARLATAAQADGQQSWGAYQHYGNPYMYFFDPSSMRASKERD